MRSRLRPVALMLVCAAKVIIPGALRAHGQDASPTARRDYPVQPVPFTAVHFNDAFWLPRIEVNRTVTIPFAFAKCEETKRVAASGAYGVERDRYNKVAFAPVATGGLRLEVVLPPQWSAGIQEWKVR